MKIKTLDHARQVLTALTDPLSFPSHHGGSTTFTKAQHAERGTVYGFEWKDQAGEIGSGYMNTNVMDIARTLYLQRAHYHAFLRAGDVQPG